LGKVYIIGAGPGDPGLITVKALEIIRKADVILYDRLIPNEVLEYAPKKCLLIYVGKEKGKHQYTQEEINHMLLRYSKSYNVVVRLKGGDPFIYGRGEEEMLFLNMHGVETEIIPGVSSVYAAPAYAGIPLTNRELSSSIAIITAQEAYHKKHRRVDIRKIAGNVDTLVILMGASKFREIINELLGVLDKDTPLAVIIRGTYDNQKVYIANLGNAMTIANKVKPPAIIVIGEIVKFRSYLIGER